MISFSGNLEHLSIVDVMQLLHQTRKSGILRVKGRKGESQLVFKDGYMVSANHLNNSIRIGKILVDLNIITQKILDKALQVQGRAGSERKPLIITLINQGLVNQKEAYKGLEHLIEMVVVEILTWKKGSFTLEALPTSVNDFRFYPEKLVSEINVDTQSVLMDALRIFDEKSRDGELTDEEPPEDELFTKKGCTAMRIECSECHLTGKVDEPEMPPEGRLVSCPWCKNTFNVDKPGAVGSSDMISICPVCQYSTFGTELFAVCPQCGLVASKYQAKLRKKQEMEQEQQRAWYNQELELRSIRNPYLLQAPAADEERNAALLTVRYTGRGCFALGVAFLCYGLCGLVSFYGNDWQTILSEGRLEPISKIEVFFRLGFLPWLFTLFSSVFLAVVRRFLLLRDSARKEMQMVAWTGVAVCVVYETAEFINWVRMFNAMKFFNYASGLASSLLMTVLLSLPFFGLLLYLQSKGIVREFPK
ncbi:MAG TPA: DUF4388 domain-containing protein [Geobacteraceae bacterium]|nr:DUF4388 domain-containing protein [Geobacteraceae bacterium]